MANYFRIKKLGFFVLILTLFFPNLILAGHRGGGNFTYSCLGGNTYLFRYCVNMDCDVDGGYKDDYKICVEDVNGDDLGDTWDPWKDLDLDKWPVVDTTYYDVAFCDNVIAFGAPCDDNSPYNWLIEVCYEQTVILDPAFAPYNFFACDGGNRPDATNSDGNSGAVLHFSDLTGVCNTSADNTNQPHMFFCKDSIQTLEYNIVDPDGDSLSMYLGPCVEHNDGDSIDYEPGYSSTNPFPSAIGWNVDQNTGNITFQINSYEQGPICLYIEEWRNGMALDTMVIDHYMSVVDCDFPVPAAQTFDSTVIAGDLTCLDIPYDTITFPGRIITVQDIIWDPILVASGATFTTNIPPTDADISGQLCWDAPCSLWGQGPFTVQIALIDDACPVFQVDTVEINLLVASAFAPNIIGPNPVCEWTDGHIYSTPDVPGHIYTWLPTGGSVASPQGSNTITIDWENEGVGTLQLTEQSPGGCDTIVSIQVQINPRPDPMITPDSAICELSQGHFYSTPDLVNHSYLWDVTTGGSVVGLNINNSVIVNWGANGIGNLQLLETIDSSGCDTTYNVPITIHNKPDPVILSNPLQCENSLGNLFYTPHLGPTYDWLVVGGTIVSGDGSDSIFVDWDGAGIGLVSLTVTNPLGCDSMVSVTPIISPRPDPSIIGPDTVCEYTDSHLFISPTPGPGFLWEIVNGGFLSPPANDSVYVEFYGSGVGQMILTETNPIGCDTTETLNVVIHPKANPNIQGSVTGCETEPGAVYYTTTSGPLFDWSVSNGVITAGQFSDSIVVVWGLNGPGQIILTETNGFGCDTTEISPVNVLIKPHTIITGADSVCEFTNGSPYNNSGPGPNYSWTVTGNGSIGSGNPTNTLLVNWGEAGTGQVICTELNAVGCDTTTIIDVTIMPNPEPTIQGPMTVCEHSEDNIYFTASPGPNYSWVVFGGSIISGDGTNSINVSWNQSGIGSISLTEETAFGCDTIVNSNILIHPKSNPDIIGDLSPCQNTTASFYSTSSPGPIYNWIVTGGNIISGQGSSVLEVQWGPSGLGEVILTEENALGCDTTETLGVTIDPKPGISIIGASNLCENASNILYYTPTPGPTWFWQVDGGDLISGQGNDSIFVNWGATGGPTTVTLTETNGFSCDSTLTLTVTIDPNPDPLISGLSTVCAYSDTIIYSTNSVGPNFAWTVNGGILVSGDGTDSIGVVWLGSGAGEVILNELNIFGCDSIDTLAVVINPNPIPSFVGVDTICEFTNGELYSTGSPGPFYTWTVQGGDIFGSNSNPNLVVDWKGAGIGQIELNEINVQGCDTTIVIPVIIEPKPVPNPTGNLTVCEKSGTLFYSTTSLGPTYNWTVTGGVINPPNGNSAVSVNWGTQGVGTVTLLETNSFGCDSSQTIVIDLDPKPTPSIVGDTIICENTLGEMYSTISIGPDYNWNVVGGVISSGDGTNSILVDWGLTGVGSVSLIETNSVSCDSTVSINITINPVPVPVLLGDQSVCEGDSNMIYSTTSSGPGFNWTLIGGVFVSGENSPNPVIDWLVPGMGSLILQDTNVFGCIGSDTLDVSVETLPVGGILGGISNCNPSIDNLFYTTGVGPNYIWDVSGGFLESGQGTDSVLVTWASAGSGYVSLTESSPTGCSVSDTLLLNVDPLNATLITGPTSICENSGLSIYSISTTGPFISWTIIGGSIINGDGTDSVEVEWGNAGLGQIIVEETNIFGCTSHDTLNLTINPKPVLTINGNQTVCEFSGLEVYSSSTPGPDYSWTVIGGSIQGSDSNSSVSVMWDNQGVGTVNLNETNGSGCISTQALIINIDPKPNPVIVGDTILCEYTFGSAYSTSSIGPTFNWTVVGGVLVSGGGTNSITVDWGPTGIGTVSLLETNTQSCDLAVSINVVINPVPTPVLFGDQGVCEGDSNLIYSSTSVGPGFNWTIIGGIIISGENSSNPVVDWVIPGAGSLILQDTNGFGCIGKDTLDIIVEAVPLGGILGGISNCNPSIDNLFYTTGVGPNFTWDVSGGFLESGQGTDSVLVTWASPGSGYVSLTESSPTGCSVSDTLLLNVDPLNSTLITGPTTICENSGLSIYSISTTGPFISWTIIGGSIINGDGTDSVEVEWGNAGLGQIIVEETNIFGCTSHDTLNLTINPKPILTISGNQTVCEFSGLEVYTSSTPGPDYLWTIIGGSIQGSDSNSSVSVMWDFQGVGTVNLAETNGSGCVSAESLIIEIDPKPAPIILGDTFVCEYSNGWTYTTTSSGPTFNWSIINGAITSGQGTNTVTVDWGSTGLGLLTLQETNTEFCDSTVSQVILINPINISLITGDDPVCEYSTGNVYTALSPGPGYSWEIIGGTITGFPALDQVEVEWGPNGTGEVIISETNTFGCIFIDTMDISIEEKPAPSIIGDLDACENTLGNIFSTTTPGPGYDWTVIGGQISAGDGTPTIFVDWGQNGPGEVSLLETNASGCDTLVTVFVNIFPKPNTTIVGGAIVCENTSSNLYSTLGLGPIYDWTVSGGVISSGDSTDEISVDWGLGGLGTVSLYEENVVGCDTTVSLDITIGPKENLLISGPIEVCENSDGHIYSTSSLGPNYNWSIIGGVITSGVGNSSISVQWGLSGPGQLLLTVDNGSGCNPSVQIDVIINPRPVPFFSGPSTVCEYTPQNFYTSAGVGPQFDWIIAGGFSMNGLTNDSLEVYWVGSGIGTVTLIETNLFGCDSSLTQNVTIHPKNDPVINGPTSICEFTLNQTYFTTSSGPSYDWEVIGGTITAGDGTSSIFVNWDSAGTGEVWVTEVNGSGCDTTEKILVQINPLPSPSISGPDSVCLNSFGIIYSTAWSLGHTYDWSIVGGTIVGLTTQNFIEVDWGVSANGFIQLTEVDTTTGCSTIVDANIFISPRPMPLVLGPDTVCERTPNISYSVVDVSGDNYQWNVIGGDIVGGAADSNYIEVMWSNAGIGLIQVTQSRGGCDSTVGMTVVVRPRPTPFVSGADSVCEFSTDHWYSTPSVVSHSYFWTVSGGTMGTVGTSDSISMNWGSEGPGWVEVQETNIYGCDSVYRKPVVIMPHPDPVITPDSMVCEYTMGHFYCTPESQGDQYFWSVSGGTIDGTDTINCVYIDWLANGIGNVTLTQVSPFGCDTTISKDIIINLKPEPMIGPLDPVCENSGNHVYCTEDNATSIYEWIVDGGSIVGVSDSSCVVIDWDGAGVGHLEVWEQIITNGCDTLATADIVIHPRPDPMILGIDTLCEYSVSGLWTPLVSGNSYNWNLSTGTVLSGATTDSVTMYWDVMGPLEIMLTETIDTTGCDTTIIDSLLINPRPIPVISGADSICELSEMMTYSIAGSIGSEYHWSVMGGWIIGPIDSNVITVNWGLSGAGSVTVTEIYPECDSTVSVPVTIMPRPNPGIAGLDSVCERSSGVIYSTPMNVSETYFWNVTGGVVFGTANSDSVVIDWGETGMGEVSLNVLSDFGCDSSLAMNVALLNAPEPSISPDSIVCEFSVNNQFCTPYSSDGNYDWQVIGGNIIGPKDINCVIIDWGIAGPAVVTVMETLDNGCELKEEIKIEIHPNPAPFINNNSDVCPNSTDNFYCVPNGISSSFTWGIQGGEILGINGTNCVQVHWFEPDIGFVSLTETFDLTGCSSTFQTGVNIYSPFSVNISGPDEVCSFGEELSYSTSTIPNGEYQWQVLGGSGSSLSMDNNYSVEWENPGVGIISVLVRDTITGCSISKSDSIVIRSFDAFIDSLKSVDCFGGADGFIEIGSEGGFEPYTYYWDFPHDQNSSIASGLSAGSYSVVVEDSRGCKDSVYTTVVGSLPMTIDLIPSHPSCEAQDGAIRALVNGGTPGYNYFWDTNPAQSVNPIQNLSAGAYTVFVFDSLGCIDSGSVILDPPGNFDILVDEVHNVSCFEGADGFVSIEVIGTTPPYQYSWSTDSLANDAYLNNLEVGTYIVSVTDNQGCSSILPIEIGQPDPLSLVETVHPETCIENNGSIFLQVEGGIEPYNYYWEEYPNQSSPYLEELESGAYFVSVEDQNGCSVSKTIIVEEIEMPPAIFISDPVLPDTLYNPPVSVSFQNLTGSGASIFWQLPDGSTSSVDNPEFVFNKSGDFCVYLTVLGDDGCISQDSICNIVVLEGKVEPVNTITPNGDGNNDFFVIDGIENFPNNELTVFNRWGNLVYKKGNYQNSWSGENGRTQRTLPAGSYYYVLTLEEGQNPVIGYVVIYR